MAEAGADMIHVDVMDGHFVPNLTIGPAMVAALRRHCALPLDVHLMVRPAAPHIDAFAEAGADGITIHVEAEPKLRRTLRRIAATGKQAGVAINPETPASAVEPLLDDVDLVLAMTVNPGFGGQTFMADQLSKIETLRALIDRSGRPIDLEVDGGIDETTGRRAADAGANLLVAGSASFRGGPSRYRENIARLRHATRSDAPPAYGSIETEPNLSHEAAP